MSSVGSGDYIRIINNYIRTINIYIHYDIILNMTEIVFQRKFRVERDSFSEETIKKFNFANEYFEILLDNKSKTKNSKDLDKFIYNIANKKNFKKEYSLLTEKEKEYARDLIYTLIQLKPENIDKTQVLSCLSNENAKGKKAIISSLELLEIFLKEKTKNTHSNKMPFLSSQNEYIYIINAVGKSIVSIDSKYVEKNNFIKIE